MASMTQKTLEEKRLETRIAKLRAKQDDLEEKARDSKKRIQALKRKKKAVLTRQVRQAQARLNAHERRRRTRRLILMGTLLEHQVSQSEEALSELLRDLDDFLKRDRDRELFELPPLAEPVPDSSAPDPDLVLPSSPELPPLRGWTPENLPQRSCGSSLSPATVPARGTHSYGTRQTGASGSRPARYACRGSGATGGSGGIGPPGP